MAEATRIPAGLAFMITDNGQINGLAPVMRQLLERGISFECIVLDNTAALGIAKQFQDIEKDDPLIARTIKERTLFLNQRQDGWHLIPAAQAKLEQFQTTPEYLAALTNELLKKAYGLIVMGTLTDIEVPLKTYINGAAPTLPIIGFCNSLLYFDQLAPKLSLFEWIIAWEGFVKQCERAPIKPVDTTKFISTGAPTLDAFRDLVLSAQKTPPRESFGLNQKQPTILYAGGYVNPNNPNYIENFKAFIRFMQAPPFSDYQIIITPHPRYSIGDCRDLEEKWISEVAAEYPHFHAPKVMYRSQLTTPQIIGFQKNGVIVFSEYSTVSVQAPACGLPSFFFDPAYKEGQEIPAPGRFMEDVPTITSLSQLRDEFRKLEARPASDIRPGGEDTARCLQTFLEVCANKDFYNGSAKMLARQSLMAFKQPSVETPVVAATASAAASQP